MLTLLTYAPGFDEPSGSPFCVKAMCLLEMSRQPWERKDLMAPNKMPMQRLPVLRTPQGLVPDSAQIERYLTEQGADFYPGMTTPIRAQAHALIRMTEENLRLGLVYERWMLPENWPLLKEVFFGALPAPLRAVVPMVVRRKVHSALVAHGIAQFPEPDRTARLKADVQAIGDTLGDKPFLFGDTPSGADAAIGPVLSMIKGLPTPTGLQRAVAGDIRLSDYVTRVRGALYPKEA